MKNLILYIVLSISYFGIMGCSSLINTEPPYPKTEPPDPKLDKKIGRYFTDQPDVTDDYQIHFIYMLDQYGDDNEWDINGQMGKELLEMNEKMFELTGGKQKYKFDYRKDGKLDISFIRLDKRGTTYKGWGMNYPVYFAQKKGFNNPKKLYFSWVDFNHRKDGGNMGVNHGYLYLQSRHNYNKKKRIGLTLHELLHGQGFSWPCTKGDDGVHVLGMSIIGSQQSTHALEEKRHRTLGDMIYDHDNKGCPDLKDSVYLTPTSKNPYDPLPLMCNLTTRSGHWSASFSGGRSNWNFKWPKRYDHKKFDESDNWKKEYYCNYQFSEYAELDWFKYWCPMGLFIWSENIDPITGTCK